MERLTYKLKKPTQNGFEYVGINGANAQKVLKKLGELEDLEEQGLLLKLPCKVGDTVYRINQYAKEPIFSMKVIRVCFKESYIGYSTFYMHAIDDEDSGEFCYFQRDIGKTVFLTKAEAEKALSKLSEVE